MKNLIFYGSYYEAIKELPVEEQGKVYKAVVDYAMAKIEPNLTGVAKAIFVLIKPTLDASVRAYENGKKGGRPNQSDNQDKNQNDNQTENLDNNLSDNQQTNQSDNQNETDIIFEKEKEKENLLKENKEKERERKSVRSRAFIKPSLQEVEEYANSRRSNVDPQKFFDYFDAGDWVDSKGVEVKNWKQKFITWENKSREKESEKETQLVRAAKRLGVLER